MKRPVRSWVWLYALAFAGSFCLASAISLRVESGWTPWAIVGVAISLFNFYCFFYEWEHPLS
jgi:hypothetical protein